MGARSYVKRFPRGLVATAILAGAFLFAAPPTASATHLMNDPWLLEYDYFWGYANYQNFGTEPPNEPGVTGGPAINDPDCPANGMSNTTWWQVQGTGGHVTVTTAEDRTDTDIDSLMAIYVENTSGDLVLVDCNDDPAPGLLGAEVGFDSDFLTDYFVQVGQLGPEGGILEIVARADDKPPNDDRAQAETLSEGPEMVRDNLGATLEPGEGSACGNDYNKSVWFKYTLPGPGSARFDLSSPFFTNAAFNLFEGDSTTPLQCGLALSSFEFRLDTGDRDGGTFYVQVAARLDPNDPEAADFDPDEGLFGVTTVFTPRPPKPPTDSDGDGIPDSQDLCPALGGRNASAYQGCPDEDQDGVPEGPGGRDACPGLRPASVGRRDVKPNDGCPDILMLHKRVGLSRSVLLARGGITLQFFRVTGVPAGATVKVRCRLPGGGRCGGRTVRRASTAQARARAAKTITARIDKRLPFGATITTRTTAPYATGSFIRFKVARNAKGFTERFFCMNHDALRRLRPRSRGCQ